MSISTILAPVGAHKSGLLKAISWSESASTSEHAAIATPLAKQFATFKAEISELKAELAAVKERRGRGGSEPPLDLHRSCSESAKVRPWEQDQRAA
jgi:hypothetical protein